MRLRTLVETAAEMVTKQGCGARARRVLAYSGKGHRQRVRHGHCSHLMARVGAYTARERPKFPNVSHLRLEPAVEEYERKCLNASFEL